MYESFEYGLYSLKLDKCDKLLLVSIYRCQHISISIFFEEFISLLEQLITTNCAYVLAGDMNIHFETDNDSAQKLKSILASFNMTQHVDDPTNKFGHIIDQVISPMIDYDLVSDVKVQDMSLSDHFLVSFNISCSALSAHTKQITFRNLKAIDNDSFSQDLSQSLVDIDLSGSFCDTVSNYNYALSTIMDKHAPKITKVVKVVNKAPWFNEEYRILRRQRRKAERRFRNSKWEVDRLRFVELRKMCTQRSFIMKKQYYRSMIDLHANNSKMLYSFINRLTDRRPQQSLPSNADDKKLAHEFSQFYVDKIVNIRNSIPKNHEDIFSNANTPNDTFIDTALPGMFLNDFSTTNVDELKRIVSKYGIKTSSEDPAPHSVLTGNLDMLLPVWVKIINQSLASGDFEGALKEAVVNPLLKGHGLDFDHKNNFRPISNLQFLGKLTERVVLSRLNDHMSRIGCTLPNQYGYKSGHNTESLIVKITNDLLIASDSKTATVLILLDLSAAFDTIDKHKLLQILFSEIKIAGNALKWFRSYLFGRSQRVKVRNELSEEVILEFGVPQGSVLGPVLFNIYIRSLYSHVERLGFSIKGFADDHQVYTSFTPEFQFNMLAANLNDILNSISWWMNQFFLKLNPEKTQIIVFGSPDILARITINGYLLSNGCIRFISNVKNLGFYLDKTLSCDTQINEIVKSCFMSIKSISSIKHFLGYEQNRMLASSLILSKLDYCNSVYFGTHSDNLRKLQSVQNSAARLIFGPQVNDPLSVLFDKLHWLPIRNRIIFKICVYVHKCLYHVAPDELMSLLHPADSFIRTAKLKSTFTPQTMFGFKAFSVSAPKAWNSLTFDLRSEWDLTKFKKSLKTFLYPDSSSTLYNSILHL